MKSSSHLLVVLFLIAVSVGVVGCQVDSAESSAVFTAVPTSLPTETPKPLAPPVISTLPPEPAQHAFTLPSAAELQPTPTNTAQPPTADPATPTPLPTETPTPQPTFTPPALPGTSENEHYWLRRPVPDGNPIWTNKTYPYGSTRGGQLRTHTGVEFDVIAGTPILAAATGTVVFAGSDDGEIIGPQRDFYGNAVVIEHETLFEGQPVYTLYGHLSEIFVQVGQQVDAEEIIAFSGATGVADGPHLHFEVRVGNNDYASTYNPLLWLYPFEDRGTIAGLVLWPDGARAHNVPVSISRIDAPSPYKATTTYADESVNSDSGWGENFVIDDVTAGYYEVVVTQGKKKLKQELWVYPYQTSYIEFTLEAISGAPTIDLEED